MRRSWSVAVAAVLASLPLATAGKAQEQRGEFRVYSENDRYNWFTDHTDRFYTQGLRVESAAQFRDPEGSSCRGSATGTGAACCAATGT